jgi:hypothetical protein
VPEEASSEIGADTTTIASTLSVGEQGLSRSRKMRAASSCFKRDVADALEEWVGALANDLPDAIQ